MMNPGSARAVDVADAFGLLALSADANHLVLTAGERERLISIDLSTFDRAEKNRYERQGDGDRQRPSFQQHVFRYCTWRNLLVPPPVQRRWHLLLPVCQAGSTVQFECPLEREVVRTPVDLPKCVLRDRAN